MRQDNAKALSRKGHRERLLNVSWIVNHAMDTVFDKPSAKVGHQSELQIE